MNVSLSSIPSFQDKVESTIQKLRSKIDCSSPTSIPFNLITFIFTHKNLNNIITKLLGGRVRDTDDKLQSSCANTANTIAKILFGKRADIIIEFISTSKIIQESYRLTEDIAYVYRISGLFDGMVQSQEDANQRLKVYEHAELPKLFVKESSQFSGYINNLWNELRKTVTDPASYENVTAFQIILKRCKFDFNSATIDRLINEMHVNQDKISSNLSYIYVVKILNILSEQLSHNEHCFIIEQFMRDDNKRIGNRIYQSWISQSTLIEDMLRRKYGMNGENSWDSFATHFFLLKLKSLYTPNSAVSYKNTFELGPSTPVENLTTFKDHILFGKTFRYFSEPINPQESEKKLAEFLVAESLENIVD